MTGCSGGRGRREEERGRRKVMWLLYVFWTQNNSEIQTLHSLQPDVYGLIRVVGRSKKASIPVAVSHF